MGRGIGCIESMAFDRGTEVTEGSRAWGGYPSGSDAA